jgi:hypothetical protein
MFERTEVSWTFYFTFPLSALLLLRWLRFDSLFVEFRERKKSVLISSKYYPSCAKTAINQLDVNKQSLIRAHCSIVTMNFITHTTKESTFCAA